MIRKAAVPAILLAMVVGMWASPASGAKQWSPLMLSKDGHHWTSQLRKPLFRDVRMVPGQKEVRTFYVRNRGDHRARLSVRVKMKDRGHWLRSGDLRFSVGRPGKLHRIHHSRKIKPVSIPRGGVAAYQVKVKYRPSATEVPRRPFRFTLELRLTHSKGR